MITEGTDTAVLILGGTEEARALAADLAARPGLAPITALAGRTADPVRPDGAVRVGGFGGAESLAAYLTQARIAALVDATHPFAMGIRRNAAEAAALAAVPLIRLERPPWAPQPGDRWAQVPDAAAAAQALPAGVRAFLAIGRQSLAPFAAVPAAWFLLRVVDLPAGPLMAAPHETVVARGPFALTDEIVLLQQHRIDRLVVKNSGADGSAAKLEAARSLGLAVTLIDRPRPAAPNAAVTVAGAVAQLMQALRW